MRLELFDRSAPIDGPLARLGATPKLLATLVFVFAVGAIPPGDWRWLALAGLIVAFAIGLAGVDPGVFFRRWLGFAGLFGTLAVMVGLSHPDRGRLGVGVVAGSIFARNTLAFLAMLVLAAVTPVDAILTSLGRLGLPAVLVATLRMMVRYLSIFAGELERMGQARRSRTFRRSGRLSWGHLAGMVGALFLRSFERGERVHAAMLARGYDGTARSLDGAELR